MLWNESFSFLLIEDILWFSNVFVNNYLQCFVWRTFRYGVPFFCIFASVFIENIGLFSVSFFCNAMSPLQFEAAMLFVCPHELFNRFPKLRILTLSCNVFFIFMWKSWAIFKSKRFTRSKWEQSPRHIPYCVFSNRDLYIYSG